MSAATEKRNAIERGKALRRIAGGLRPIIERRGPIPLAQLDALMKKNDLDPRRRRAELLSRAGLMLDGEEIVIPPEPTWEIRHGDALDEMIGLPDQSFDVVLTDPPYSSGATREAGKTWNTALERMSRNKDQRWFGGDSMSTPGMLYWIRACAQQWFRVLKPGGHVLCFIDWRMAPVVADAISGAIESADLRRSGLLVWDKERVHMGEFFRNRHELILHFTRGQPSDPRRRDVGNVISCPIVLRGLHPTEKPVKLLTTLLGPCAGLGSRVLDCFAGSASTGEAALRIGASFTGIERDDHYHRLGSERLTKVAAAAPWRQLDLLGGDVTFEEEPEPV